MERLENSFFTMETIEALANGSRHTLISLRHVSSAQPYNRSEAAMPLFGDLSVALLPVQETQRQGFEEKVMAYSEVCRNFRPVFRYFCMERFLDPAVWMEKRLAYTRSVATSSIGTPPVTEGGVGYLIAMLQ